MVARAHTVAFLGVEARPVEVQCAISPGLPAFSVVGLPDKAVSESKERVRAALNGIGVAIPPQRITVNLSPADLPKAGSHYDLPIALVADGRCRHRAPGRDRGPRRHGRAVAGRNDPTLSPARCLPRWPPPRTTAG